MTPSPAPDDAVTQRSIEQLAALPASLLDEPLDFIFADHFRQRCLCAVLQSIAWHRSVPRSSADRIAAFLSRDLVLHHQDEDADLFPALRERAQPEDGLPPILDRLSEDHRLATPLITEIATALSVMPPHAPVTLPAPAADTMFAYVAAEQRHLSVENGIVLVLARKRLKNADLVAMSEAMKTRRLGAC